MKTYSGIITPAPGRCMVFGSNTEGRHGKGAALYARNYFGARYGQPNGRQGMSYAIVTKDLRRAYHPSIPFDMIEAQIGIFYDYAKQHPELEFWVAYGINKNLNGYTPAQMAKMFASETPPQNVVFQEDFAALVQKELLAKAQ